MGDGLPPGQPLLSRFDLSAANVIGNVVIAFSRLIHTGEAEDKEYRVLLSHAPLSDHHDATTGEGDLVAGSRFLDAREPGLCHAYV